MKKVVYIVVEVKARELNGKLLLAAELLKRGYTVIIGNTIQAYERAEDSANPGILIDKCFGSSSYAHWVKIHNNRGKVYSWDEEAIVYMNSGFYLRQRVDKNSINEVDGIIAWGADQKNILTMEYPQLKNKLFPLGNPRIDILDKKFLSLWNTKINEYRNKYGNYILVNYSLTTSAYEIQRVKANFQRSKVITEEDRKLFIERLEWIDTYNKAFSEGIMYLAQRTNRTIIIRPHPGDNGDWLKSYFFEEKPVYVIGEGNSNPWILGADTLIHQGSTSAVEAFIQNKESILYAPNLEMKFYGKLAVDVSQVITDKEDLVKFVEKQEPEENKANTQKRKEKLDYFIFNETQEFAAERIANLLDSNFYSKEPYAGKKSLPIMERIEIERASMKKPSIQKKNDLTSKKEIRQILYQIQKSMNYDFKYKLQVIDRNLFLLTPSKRRNK